MNGARPAVGRVRRYGRSGFCRIPGLLGFVSLICLVASCGGEGRERRLVTQVEVVDSAGVSRVRILDLFQVRLPAVEARRIWTMDSPELNAVRDAWIEEGGSVLVANSGRSEILRIDPDGELTTRWGSTGEGAGEFSRLGLSRLGPGGDGGVLAWDERRSRLTLFTANGGVRGIRRVAPPEVGSSLRLLAVTPDGSLMATYADIRDFDRERSERDTMPLLAVRFADSDNGDSDSGRTGGRVLGDGPTSVDTLGTWPGTERFVVPTSAGPAGIPVGFGNRTLFAGAGPVVAVSPSESVDLQVYREGRLSALVRATAPARSVTDRDAERWREDLSQKYPGTVVEEAWRTAPVEDVYPTLDRLVVGQDGKIWMGIHPEYAVPERDFVLLEPEGIPVGRLRIPKDVEILAASSEHFVGLERADLDAERITLWRIE